MNHLDRFHKVMNFETVDRVPNYELGVWPQTVDRWISEGLPRDQVYWNWFEGEPYFQIDRRGFAPVYTGMCPSFDYEVLEEDDRYVTARNEQGIITKALKEGTIGRSRMCMDTYISFPVTDRASFAELVKTRYKADSLVRYPLWWDEWARIWKNRDYPLCLQNNGTFGLYSGLRAWVGTEALSYLFYDDPAFVDQMLEFQVNFLFQVTEKALAEVQFDYFNFFEDFAGKATPLISPQIFRRFFLPAYKKITDRFRKAGVRYFWFDSDGTVDDSLVALIIEAGINCFWPLEQPSGMDPVRLRKKFGKTLVLAGGIDKLPLRKGKKEIEAELYAKIPPMLETGGYFPHLDHTFPPDIPYENFLYYMELKKKLMGW